MKARARRGFGAMPAASASGMPSRERQEQASLDHTPVERVGDQMRDSDGRISSPWRVLPLLDGMVQRKAINADMRAAGQAFHDNFRLAQLDGLRAASLLRVGGCGTGNAGSGNERARKAVTAAIKALGGGRALAASCVWHVLGLEESLRQWAAEHHTGNANEAAGVLAAALGVLAKR